MKISVADGRTDNHALIAHHPLMPYYLCGKGLHHHNRVCSHPFPVMEKLGHTENHHIIFLLRKRYIGPFIRHFPGSGLHFFGISGKNSNLPGGSIQDRIAAEKLLSHTFFHMLADFIEFGPHHGMSAHRNKILLVHYLGHMMGSN